MLENLGESLQAIDHWSTPLYLPKPNDDSDDAAKWAELFSFKGLDFLIGLNGIICLSRQLKDFPSFNAHDHQSLVCLCYEASPIFFKV